MGAVKVSTNKDCAYFLIDKTCSGFRIQTALYDRSGQGIPPISPGWV
jgi:hypothetical protein